MIQARERSGGAIAVDRLDVLGAGRRAVVGRRGSGGRRGAVAAALALAALSAVTAALVPCAGATVPGTHPTGALPYRTSATGATATTPPPLAHVVVVIEENHGYGRVVGNPAAPYLQHLIAGGALLTRARAVSHPSEPNYLALFSGSTHGVTDDSCPHRFAGPDLADSLRAAGAGFVGFAEGLPRTGDPVCSAGAYARKHAPWTDFADVPAAASRPMSRFPSDPARLPAVSFVVPDLRHDMHDGTIAQADTWLQRRLGGYVRWARGHDSALVVTWDEDEGSTANHVATVLVGAHVRPGRYGAPTDHYRLLRTIEWLFGAAPTGRAAARAPLTTVWRR